MKLTLLNLRNPNPNKLKLNKYLEKYLITVPSLIFGLIGASVLYFRPLPYEVRFGFLGMIALAAFLVAVLLGSAWVLEKTLPSFRNATLLLERSLGAFNISLPFAFTLAALSSVAEELLFRGALLPLIGVWGQALLFGLMHPAPRKAWSYTVFTGVAGLVFGYATLYSGSLIPAMTAHFVINLQGFLELRQKNLKLKKKEGERSQKNQERIQELLERQKQLANFIPKSSVEIEPDTNSQHNPNAADSLSNNIVSNDDASSKDTAKPLETHTINKKRTETEG